MDGSFDVTQLGFSTPKNFNPVSWLVRKLTGSTCSHVFFIYRDREFELEMVMEAHELGFRIVPYERFVRENNIVWTCTPKVDLTEGLKWAAKYLGTAYDFGGLIGMAFVVLARIFKRRIKNPLQNSRSMFCSEITVHAIKRGHGWHEKYPGLDAMRAASTSPQDLMEFLQEAHRRAD